MARKRKLKTKGLAWYQDRKRESQEPWEKRYKKKSKGLAYASKSVRIKVARMGGKASRGRRRR